jgi:DNA (cytosine-5)-methyltransferase 1
LQGFTDEMLLTQWAIQLIINDKQAGNSVTVTVVFALGMKILEVKREMVGDDCGR